MPTESTHPSLLNYIFIGGSKPPPYENYQTDGQVGFLFCVGEGYLDENSFLLKAKKVRRHRRKTAIVFLSREVSSKAIFSGIVRNGRKNTDAEYPSKNKTAPVPQMELGAIYFFCL